MGKNRASARAGSGSQSDGPTGDDEVDEKNHDADPAPAEAPPPFDPRKYHGYLCPDLQPGLKPQILFSSPIRDFEGWGWRPRWFVDGEEVLGRRECTMENALAKTFWKIEAWCKAGKEPNRDF